MDSSDDDTFGEDSNINENSDNSDLGEIDEIFEEDDDDDQSSMICDLDNTLGAMGEKLKFVSRDNESLRTEIDDLKSKVDGFETLKNASRHLINAMYFGDAQEKRKHFKAFVSLYNKLK